MGRSGWHCLLQAVTLATLALALASAASAGEDAVKLAPNAWTPLGKVNYDFPAEFTGQFNLRFWNTMSWDRDAERILFWEGYKGSHGQQYSIYANAIYSLTPADRTVKLINLSTGWKSGGGHYMYQPTSQPASPYPRHTWGAFTYVPKYKRIYIGTGAAGAAHAKANNYWSYDVTKRTWTDVTGTLPGPTGFQTHFAHFTDSDTLWVFSKATGGWTCIYAFDMSKQSWAEKHIGKTDAFELSHVAVDRKRGKALVRVSFRKPFESRFAVFDPAKPELTPIPHPAQITERARMVYIPRHDRYFIHDPASGTDWTCDPATGQFRQIKASPGDKLRMDNYIVYDEANDLVVIYTIEDQFKLFRYVPEGPASQPEDGRTPAD